VTTPESCVLELDVTFLPEQADESGWDSLVVREVEEWITRFAATDPWLAEHPPRFSWSMSTPPLEIEPTEPVVASLTHALERMARPVKLSGLDSWYDGATFARIHGTPAVGFGPGSIKVAHAVDEFVPIDELVGSATGIALALVHHCGVASLNGDSPSPEGSP
jgi:acetylornithine deacetylase